MMERASGWVSRQWHEVQIAESGIKWYTKRCVALQPAGGETCKFFLEAASCLSSSPHAARIRAPQHHDAAAGVRA
jgi:hypothetical protein